MKEGKVEFISVFFILIGAILIGATLFFVFFTDDITTVLDEECKKEGMEYAYYKGTNCIDEDDVLHPFIYDCSTLVWKRDDCKIRFIKE